MQRQLLLQVLLSLSTLCYLTTADMWCYSCNSNQPGCTDGVNWLFQHAVTCPRPDDKCVKIIERKGEEVLYTRECLSNLEPYRYDIPADTYEGCRPAAEHPKLAVYVDNNIRELELKREYYDSVEYCFCQFWHWCNGAQDLKGSTLMIIAVTSSLLYTLFGMHGGAAAVL